jgi:hypothetical protein
VFLERGVYFLGAACVAIAPGAAIGSDWFDGGRPARH